MNDAEGNQSTNVREDNKSYKDEEEEENLNIDEAELIRIGKDADVLSFENLNMESELDIFKDIDLTGSQEEKRVKNYDDNISEYNIEESKVKNRKSKGCGEKLSVNFENYVDCEEGEKDNFMKSVQDIFIEQCNSNDDNLHVNELNSNVNLSKNHKSDETEIFQEPIEYDHLPDSYQNRKAVSALTPIFTFGYNTHIPIINLSTDKRCFLLYSASHLVIIYDYFHNDQMVLQGHTNSITCTTASKDKRWLASGDKGENSMVIIWDCNTGLPVRSMFEPHPNGVVSISLTPDARYLASLSAENEQTFAIWDWTTGEDIPLCSSTLSPNFGIQCWIAFNEFDYFHVATNSQSQVLFYQWDKLGNIKYYSPKVSDKDFNKQVGNFSSTVYLPQSTKAISATSQGLLVVWEGNVPLVKEYVYDRFADLTIGRYKVSNEATADKKATKLVPAHDTGINVLCIIDSFIVTGDVDGHIKFFDFNFMLMFWYNDWKFGPISSISVSNKLKMDSDVPNWKFRMMLETSDYPGDATIPNNKFYFRDFVVGTTTTVLATVAVEGSKIKIIFREHDQLVFSMAAHPTLSIVATGSYSGLLKIWDYIQRRTLKTRFFDNNPIKCMCFDHIGLQLAVGFTNGEVRILDTHALGDVTKEPFHFSQVHITHILFSERSEYLATVDANGTLTMYISCIGNIEEPWVYLARFRAHYKPVVDLIFGRYFDSELPRVFTLGADRRLVEYDLLNVSKDHLPIAHDVRIEQASIPLSMCWYPEENGEGFLVIANDEYKLKMYNHQTKVCRFTFLGPSFGSAVKIVRTLPPGSDHPVLPDGYYQRYIAYANDNKIGLIRLPFDGNPYNYMTMIAHPRGVTNLCCSFDGKYLISVGEDFIVTVWKIDVDLFESQVKRGGTGMTPYYELIEGGEFGAFMNELKDYFYYSMIRTQGIDSLDKRKVDVVIEINEVPNIMRGIGFYPTEEDIQNMQNELKFQDFHQTGNCRTKVEMDTFLKLYINHRPTFGIPSSRVDDAFRQILKINDGPLTIDKFLSILTSRGEKLQEEELSEYLATLLGYNYLGGSLEMESFEPSKVMNDVNASLPKVVTSKNFIKDILCMNIVDKESYLRNTTSTGEVVTIGTQTSL